MAVESGARPSNTLSGELRSRPLPVLLAGACERKTSGSFTFRYATRTDVVTMRAGKIAGVRSTGPVAYLGGVLYELGAIDAATLDRTLLEVSQTRRLHGQILLEAGAITQARLDEGLAEQSFRKMHHVFDLPEEATWSFRADVDDLQGAVDDGRPTIDPWQVIWRALRDRPVPAHVQRVLAKVEGGIQLRDVKVLDRFGLTAEERRFCEALATRPAPLTALVGARALPPGRTELLVYLLALSRSIARVETPPVGPGDLGVDGVRQRAHRIGAEEPHVALGIGKGASVEAARAAYFRLARLWHPERIPRALDEVRAECEYVLGRLGEAHRLLTDGGSVRPGGSIRPVGEPGRTSVPAPALSSIPPFTMADVDAALARNDLELADALARNLSCGGADGPSARAVVAWCGAAAGMSASQPSLERALAALDKVLTGDPDCARALFYRAKIATRLSLFDVALRDYRKVARLDPRHFDAIRELRLMEERRRSLSEIPRALRSEMPRALRSVPPPVPPSMPPPTDRALPAPPGPPADDDADRSGLRRLLSRAAGR